MPTPFYRLAAAAIWISLLLTGCESPGREGAQAVAPQTALEGAASLFQGSVEMRVAVAPFFSEATGSTRGRPGGPGDFRSRNRVREEFGTNDLEAEGERRRSMTSAEYAPATHRLRVSFANTSSSRIQMDVFEVRSILGVFGVRPNRLTIEPGQVVELDPMRSAIGESFESIDVAVQVRHRGKADTVTVRLTAAGGESAARE